VNKTLANTELPSTWVRSSYSNGAGGECVECARAGDLVFVRDTKVGGESVSGVRAQAWFAFTRAVGRGWPDRTHFEGGPAGGPK
jgi:hypothetical protein